MSKICHKNDNCIIKSTIKKLVKNKNFCYFIAIFFAVATISFATIFTNLIYREKTTFKRGFEIALDSTGKAVPKTEEKPVDLAVLMQTADYNRGAKIFKKCASCHNINKGEGAKVGPNLYGVVNRTKASFAGFEYSQSLKEKGGIWDIESINSFLIKPKAFASGTKMAFAGLKKPQERADIILFLQQNAK